MRNTFTLYILVVGLFLSFSSRVSSQTFFYLGAPVNIPDGACPGETTADIAVTGIGALGAGIFMSTVCFDMTHTFTADMEVSLRSPNGTTVPLTIDNGGGGDNFFGTCFNMEGGNGPVAAGAAPFSGTWIPDGDLNLFNDGQNADGAWSLVMCDDAGGDTGLLLFWSIEFTIPPPNDVGITAITNPTSTCGLTDMENVTVTIQNFGSAAQSNFPVTYDIGNGPVTETFAGPINPGESVDFSFSQVEDFSMTGTYTVDAAVALPGDANTANDALMVTVMTQPLINTFPIVEDFETWPLCGNNFDPCNFDCQATAQNNWTQSADDEDDWRVDNGPTPSTGTGPTQDHNPGTPDGRYLFTESSGGCTGVTSILVSPCMDVSSLAFPFVEFYMHMFGDDQGTMSLDVSQDGGVTWTNLWTQTGQLQTDDDVNTPEGAWALQEVSLAGITGVINLRWVGLTGPGFESDMALDDIRIYDRPEVDVACESIDSPVSSCGFTDMQPVTVTLKNLGADPVTNVPVEAQINGMGFVSVGMYTGTMNPGESDQYTFPLDLANTGIYNIDVRVVFMDDGDASNDQASSTIENIAPILTFPWTEDFESFTPCGNAFNPCPFDCQAAPSNNWLQGTNGVDDDDDWRVDFGNTPSGPGVTGPAQDNNPGTPTGQFLFTEASAGCDNLQSIIVSPCMDISALSNPHVDFFIHMHGSDMGTMALSITDDDGATWTQLWSSSGELQMAATDPWQEVSVQLLGYTGAIKLRWEGTTAVGFEGDMALDDIRVYDRPDYDVNVVDIIEPVSGCGLTNDESITIVLESLSIADTSMVPVAYSINMGPAVVDTFENVITPGILETFTFDQTADLSAPGEYTITAWTQFEADGEITNDTSTITIINIPVINTFPYSMGWESGAMGWESEGMNNTWELGTPAAPIINMAASGQNAWVTNLTGNYNNSELSYLISPCMDFSGLPVDPTVKFAIWYETENGFDEAWLELSVDGGLTYTKVLTTGDAENWYNDEVNEWWENTSGGWVIAENILTGSANQGDVRVRFVFSSDASIPREGVGIDDFEIIPPLDFDAEVVSPIGEYTQIPGRQANVVLKSRTENIGLNNLSNITADFVITDMMGTTVYTSNASTPFLPAGFSVLLTPPDPFVPTSGPGMYTMEVTVGADNDEDLSNNTLAYTFEITPTVYARDDNNFTAGTSLGIGAGGPDNGQLGQNFELLEADALESITFRLESPPVGDVVRANLYNTNPNGSPDSLLASTTNYVLTPADNANGVILTLDIDGGPISLDPGMYFLGVIEPGDNITLATTENIFTEGTTWITWAANPNGANVWSNNEAFGFELSYYIRANFAPCGVEAFTSAADVFDETLEGAGDGMLTLTHDGTALPYTYDWDNGATDNPLTGLDDGAYSVIVNDIAGCSDTLDLIVGPGCPGLVLEFNVADETIGGANDGSILTSVEDGIFTEPFTYSWDNGQTTANISGLEPGTYCVSVTDFYGCVGFACPSILPACGPFEVLADIGNVIIVGANNGTIDLTVDGGTPPYEYEWNNGATTEDLVALEPGNYCVTITDLFGCADERCYDVALTSVNNIVGLNIFEVNPNPATTQAVLSVRLDRIVDADIQILNVLGQPVYYMRQEGLVENQIELSVANFPPGMYYVRMMVDGEQAVRPLVIAR